MYFMCQEMVLFNGRLVDGATRSYHGAWYTTFLLWLIMINMCYIFFNAYKEYKLHHLRSIALKKARKIRMRNKLGKGFDEVDLADSGYVRIGDRIVLE